MRKVTGLIMLLPIALITSIFFVLLNLSFFANENRLKSILSESNFYDTAALYIKNEIVTKSGFKLDEGTNFEDLNQKVTGETVKPVIDETIHNIFAALNDPQNTTRIFPVRFNNQDDSGTQFSFEKYINLQQNKVFDIFSQRYFYLFLTAVGLFVLLLMGIFIYSSKASDRLFYIFIYSILTLVLLLVVVSLQRFYLPNYIDLIINKSQFFQEPKLVITAKKLVTIIINKQFLYYLAEIIGFLIVGSTALSIRKINTREKLDQIEEKI